MYFAMDNTVLVEIEIEKNFHITRHMNKPSAPASKQKYNDNTGTQARSKTHLDFDYWAKEKKNVNQHSETWSEKIKPKVFIYKKNDLIRNASHGF